MYIIIKDSKFNINIKQYNDKLLSELKSIDMLIITDCNQRQRLGRLAALIDIAKEIIIYDHHAGISCDISADKKNILETITFFFFSCIILFKNFMCINVFICICVFNYYYICISFFFI